MSTSPAIRADGLSKRYRIGTRINRYPTLRDALAARASRLRGRANDRNAGPDHVWALEDVSFEIARGQLTGIIGRNGAGKSTLLKILSRITRPTRGRAILDGRVGSLLEVGTGFHPELTGRENVFLNGAILGMTRAEIVRKLDEIVEFAEVAAFIDTPVKHYSTGMYLRLAFAVAAHLEPEILMVDEVLAVGDASFQKKCLGKMDEIAHTGRTVLLVSHNLDAIVRLCSHALFIDGGRLAAYDASKAVVSRYLAGEETKPGPDRWIDLAGVKPGRGDASWARLAAARYTSGDRAVGGNAFPGGPLCVSVRVDAPADVMVPSFAVTVRSQSGLILVNADTITQGVTLPLQSGRNEVTLEIAALHLNPGLYVVDLWLGDRTGSAIDWRQGAFYLEVVPRHEEQSLGSTTRVDALVPCSFRVSAPALADVRP